MRRDCAKVTRGLGPVVLTDAAERLAAFGAPALVAFAREDRIFPFRYGVRLAATLPDARLESIPDSRTWIMRDQPELLAGLIREFIATAPLGTAPGGGFPSDHGVAHGVRLSPAGVAAGPGGLAGRGRRVRGTGRGACSGGW